MVGGLRGGIYGGGFMVGFYGGVLWWGFMVGGLCGVLWWGFMVGGKPFGFFVTLEASLCREE